MHATWFAAPVEDGRNSLVPSRILVVCTGNICRSPSAEGVFRAMATTRGLNGAITFDSAGTSDWHVGEPPTDLAVIEAARRGYALGDLRARQLGQADLTRFDLILGMDSGHIAKLHRMAQGAGSGDVAEIALFLAATGEPERDVPDPYGLGEAAYRHSLDLIEHGCAAWLDRLVEEGRA